MLAHDESLSYNYGFIREAALTYLGHLQSNEATDGFSNFLSAQQMCQSLQSTCSFLKEADSMVSLFCVYLYLYLFLLVWSLGW